MPSPLEGLRVIEFAGLGPAPHAAMILADLGAEVTRVDRPVHPAADGGSAALTSLGPVIGHGRATTIRADLKDEAERTAILELVRHADVLLDPYRPGVAERLGVGPGICLELNPRLVYARITGWGQDGPLAGRAGHDINFIAITGALHAIGEADPVPPLNLVGDFGGGSMLSMVGILAALWERERSGLGQIVDVAMVDGACLLMQDQWDGLSQNRVSGDRQSNILDGGAPYYRTYRCADGRHVAVGAIEPQFYSLLLEGLGLRADELPDRMLRENWPALRERFARTFAGHSRDEWAKIFAGTDACVTPVLALDEVAHHPQIAARQSVRAVNGVLLASPAPRFSRS